MSLLHLNRPVTRLSLQNREDPELYRDLFPYSKISRIAFDDIHIMPRPADPMFITDTTFRDGQQARPPYTVKQISEIFDMLHLLGGMSGLIRASEFFMYSDKDRRAIDACRAKGYKYPQITGWIRANENDLKIAKSMEFTEVGMLTSVSDYHIHLKLGLDRQQAMENYLRVIEKALEWGITPRCHFEDITRADIHGFCLPFASRLMELSRQSKLPVKIRLCDTMGYGVPYPGATLPRSVPRVVRAFTDEAGVPGDWLEWHGHNDFHKVLVNGVTAWLYGCGGVNGTLMGFGERTGNSPIEALVIEYISLTGEDDAANTHIISEIGEYFERELEYRIPDNYPFVGKDFNATSAGIHVDGLNKNEEIYNIFDTRKILNRSVPIIITDKSGRAGVAYWINNYLRVPEGRQVSKTHPAVGQIYNRIMQAYEGGRTTSFSNQEMTKLVKRYLPELFVPEFDSLKTVARQLASTIILKLAAECVIVPQKSEYPCLSDFVRQFSFIQYLYLTDVRGTLLASVITDPAYNERYQELPLGYDFSNRQWFQRPSQTGELHVTDLYQSQFTGKLILTVSAPVTDENDDIMGIVGADIQLEELLNRKAMLEDNEKDA
ncbi:histone-lysine N-methyltransferase [Oleidesulfovibrio alaskensis]|jgi:isopropylmalate/homocitrate/citramalate synthase|uniref:triose-phosphate isomerase n=1 Tax=Oleidesulfovibrio alaskensis TaxID=58180 RepID=UPI001A559581|nr:histone-lysine N-methyltransferase [Oleidesulfovibrio alaskensis]MBL3583098.1 histone-lysine N-methyltransferase [Oleidesulfovibrio alaskensis]